MNESAFFKKCAAIEGAQIGDAVFSDGLAVWAGTREVAHMHADSLLEVRLTKAVIRQRRTELEADTRVTLRKNASDWIEFAVGSRKDEGDAIELVRLAVETNIATARPGLPPSGPDLARRRRFH